MLEHAYTHNYINILTMLNNIDNSAPKNLNF